ncbi:MAG TPA: tRNA lysidine(34) synthetase TilS [Gemmataceae bacterium]|jgi:tRNA(Ile)-lysidine synthase|nr:tRNA lysidine(34) synthetase TilS [Gemmataceae bacterium]
MGHRDPMSEFAATIHDNLDRLRENAPGPIVVAVSGGADSVAMLRALAESTPPGELVVAHLNHQLRGADSDADAAFVAGLLPELPHFIERIDVAAAAARANLEAKARQTRYDFLAKVAQQRGAQLIATGHTRDDQAETVLHRLIRGTGLRGLRGIAASRELAPGVRLIRPLLTVSRAEVIAYLRSIDQPWREDATNADTAFTRNRIRHELLPMLRTFNPTIEDALARTAPQANEMFAEIESKAIELLRLAERPRADSTVVLDKAAIQGVPTQLLREVLHVIWQREGWSRNGMTHAHWQRAADVAVGRVPACDLPDRIRIVGAARVVRIGPAA